MRLRNSFTVLFMDLLKKQLILKGIISPEDWEILSEEIILDYTQDSYYTEIKNTEMIRDRITLAGEMADFIGVYYSKDWVRRNVLKMSDDEIRKMQSQMDAEKPEQPAADEDNL